jgi:hypothetical protein
MLSVFKPPRFASVNRSLTAPPGQNIDSSASIQCSVSGKILNLIRIGIANEDVVKSTPGHILKVLDQATSGDSGSSRSD